ncbi:MAG: hypothetical protein ACRCXZ_05760 [Patescibacteria group bacterium]
MKKLAKRVVKSKRIQYFLLGSMFTITVVGGYLCYEFQKQFAELKTQLEVDFYANKTDKSTSDRFNQYLAITNTKAEFVDFFGTKVAYSLLMTNQEKKKTTVVIVGGLPGVDEHWAHFAKKISDRANVILIHPAGYHPSEGIRTTDSINNSTVLATRILLTQHGLWDSKLVFVGESMGGNVMSKLSTQIKSDLLILQKPMPSSKQAIGYNTDKHGDYTKSLPYRAFNYIGSVTLEETLPHSQASFIYMNIGEKDSVVSPKDQKSAFHTAFMHRQKMQIHFEENGDHWSFNSDRIERQIFRSPDENEFF